MIGPGSDKNILLFYAKTTAQDHDIAIIQLAQPVQFSDSVAPVTTIIAILLSPKSKSPTTKSGVSAAILLDQLRRCNSNCHGVGNSLKRGIPAFHFARGALEFEFKVQCGIRTIQNLGLFSTSTSRLT